MEHNAKVRVKIIENKKLSEGVFSMWIEAKERADKAEVGEFVSLYSEDESRLLPRPISICEIDRKRRRLRLVYRVVGVGTEEFSARKEGEEISVIAPLGKGFPLENAGKTSLLFGGGIGIPPLLEVAKRLCEKGIKVISILGYRNSDTFLIEDFQKYSEVIPATDDGSLGVKGTVIDAAKKLLVAEKYGVTSIYSCGPLPMLRGVKEYGEKHGILTYVSLEERMACGIGVCLGCVCETKEVDSHSLVKNKRICKDGPVFLASEVEF